MKLETPEIVAWKQKINRPAIGFDIGGFRPPDDPLGSWFGQVNACYPGEFWPLFDGKPMFALCQINLTSLPFRPPHLEDIDFITVFIASGALPRDTPNGEDWCLRTYKSVDALVPLKQPKTGSYIRVCPMRWREIPEDYPIWEDVPEELQELMMEIDSDCPVDYYDTFENVRGFKLGGWQTWIQGGPADIRSKEGFVFQIDSDYETRWQWGDGGVGYFSRSIAPEEDRWEIYWECY